MDLKLLKELEHGGGDERELGKSTEYLELSGGSHLSPRSVGSAKDSAQSFSAEPQPPRVTNLDLFFRRVYEYYQGYGLSAIISARVTNLM